MIGTVLCKTKNPRIKTASKSNEFSAEVTLTLFSSHQQEQSRNPKETFSLYLEKEFQKLQKQNVNLKSGEGCVMHRCNSLGINIFIFSNVIPSSSPRFNTLHLKRCIASEM
jgi:hypothetical protein